MSEENSMTTDCTQIRIRGKTIGVPSIGIADRTIVMTGKWIKTAGIKDEGVVEGEIVEDPAQFLTILKEWEQKPDIFTFAEKLPRVKPRFDFFFEWDNVAAVPITTFEHWWEERLPQESRKNVRRSAKRGVVVKVVQFDDELARGIHKIYANTPVRQGRPFWHHGKDFETVKREHATYLERSEFLGAYCGEELIGFIKMVYVDRIATLFHIFAAHEHHDKRPMNALVAKAVEVCAAKGMQYLIYGKYTYGNKTQSPLAEFKRRNGFEQVDFPKYYIPLTATGKVAVTLRVHRGLLGLLPPGLVVFLVGVRAKLREKLRRRSAKTEGKSDDAS